MNSDFIAYAIVACFGLFLLAGFSVTLKGFYSNWREYRNKILAARSKRNL